MWINEPLVPVTFSAKVSGMDPREQVKMDIPGTLITIVVRPQSSTEENARVTLPVKPFKGPMAIVDAPLFPANPVTVVGIADTEKSAIPVAANVGRTDG